MMRPRQLRRRLLLAGLGGVIAAATITTGVAKADPSVCGSLADSPTVGTVEQLVAAFIADGMTGREAGLIIGSAVDAGCPQYWPVLQRFVNAYASSPVGTVRA